MLGPVSAVARRLGIAALTLGLGALAACANGTNAASPMPPLRDRNYACQVVGPGETQEDEVLCEENKRPLDR
jgi:hypothetical protein